MNERILHVKVGKSLDAHLERAAGLMENLERGERPEPYFAIGFADMGQFLALFTARRWEALATLREGGPMTIAEQTRRVRRDDKNVHGDVEKLIEWQIVVEDEHGQLKDSPVASRLRRTGSPGRLIGPSILRPIAAALGWSLEQLDF